MSFAKVFFPRKVFLAFAKVLFIFIINYFPVRIALDEVCNLSPIAPWN